MMWPCGTTSLQAPLINLDQHMWSVLKCFFGYTKFYSVTAMLTELGLQKFDSLIDVEMIFNVRSVDVTTALYNILYIFTWCDWFMLCDCIAAFFSLSLSLSFYRNIFMFLLFYESSAWNEDWLIDWLIDNVIQSKCFRPSTGNSLITLSSPQRIIRYKMLINALPSSVIIISEAFYKIVRVYTRKSSDNNIDTISY